MQNGTLALNSNWLDAQAPGIDCTDLGKSGTYTLGNSFTGIVNHSIDYYYGDWWRTYCYPVIASPMRPIKLTLSEVERLRKAAKDDAKLKAILQKFTPQIEITVDFE
jgi:hypothetical protein